MPEPLKNVYNHESLHSLAIDIQSVYKLFAVDEFLESTIDQTWQGLELKERVAKIAENLRKYLPQDFGTAIGIIDKVVMNYGSWLSCFGDFFPTFVEMYGQDEANWEVSISALERYTQYASAEFAVRPFIIKHQEPMMAQMYAWSEHESEHVRRLSCEGCRPALPWAQALPKFKKDPSPILPILERLKTDSSEFVRRSVANNLNDISKTHPELVIQLAKQWLGENEQTNWVVKHACRTLLKKGNTEVLSLFGLNNDILIEEADFEVATSSIAMGDKLNFSFTISAKEATKVRLEYGIDYVKSNGKRNRKIFKISEISLKGNEKKVYSKNHSFAEISTRKHYPGIHSITLIINGLERGSLDFELKTR